MNEKKFLTIKYNGKLKTYKVIKCDRSATEIVIPEMYSDGKNGFKPVTEIGNDAFWDCESLQKLKLPITVNKIGEGAFKNCESLISVTIPEGVTEIGNAAFWGCESLQKLKLPITVNKIGEGAFKFVPNNALGDYEKWKELKTMRDFCLE